METFYSHIWRTILQLKPQKNPQFSPQFPRKMSSHSDFSQNSLATIFTDKTRQSLTLRIHVKPASQTRSIEMPATNWAAHKAALSETASSPLDPKKLMLVKTTSRPQEGAVNS
eukprot:Sdes_comp15413_c0_seq1m4297